MLLPFYSNSHFAVQKRPKIIDSQVIFGTPSRDCSGPGICKIYTIHGARRLNIACEMVLTRLAVLDEELQLSFSETACTERLIQQHFINAYFAMDEKFVLPTWLSRKFECPSVFVPVGEYPILRKSGFIWLKLPLRLLYNPS